MAKQLKKFEFKQGIGAESQYDWDQYLDGKIWQLESGSDYACKDATFSTLVRSAGAKRGLTVSINKVEGGMVIQAKEASAEQKAKWAESAQKAKDAAKARRAKKASENGEGGDEDEGEDE